MGEDFNFNIVIVIIFLLMGVIRWLKESFSRGKGTQEREHWEEYDYEERADQVKPQPSSLEDLYEQARREILDRQNRNAPQPEVIEEKLSGYRTPAPPAAPPPLPGKARVNKPPVTFKESKPVALPQVNRATLSAEEEKALAAFQELSSKKRKKTTPTGSKVSDLLSSPSAARDAIVLTEILGTPKGLN